MTELMKENLAYRQYLAALNHWVQYKKNEKQPAQKILALSLDVGEGVISRYLSQKRKTPIPFDSQVALAKACGYDYIDFLQCGKDLLEGNTSSAEPKATSLPEKESKPKPESVVEKGAQEVGDTKDELIQVYKDQLSELKQEKVELTQDLKEQRKRTDHLYTENMELSKQVGEYRQALNRLKRLQDNGLEPLSKPAANG